jgi:Uma2 family endonuclease
LAGVSWQAYVTAGEALPHPGNVRMTYHRGRLEFRTLSPEHEVWKERLARLIGELVEAFELDLVAAGSMTFRREDLALGFEPDSCFWIANELRMRGRLEWNPPGDPPPDLLLEIEVSRSALDRLGMFAAFGVPEVWRCDGEALHIHQLQANRTYAEVPASPTFPGIRPGELMPFVRLTPGQSYREWLQSFRAWVRQQRSAQPPAAQP